MIRNPFQKMGNPFSKYLDASGEQGVFDEETFKFIIRRERSRADRTGGLFSLVILSPCSERDPSLAGTIDTIAMHMRITDSIGWVSPSSIGILLPGTPREGAYRFWQRIHAAVAALQPATDMQIHTYPGEQAPRDVPTGAPEPGDAHPPPDIGRQQGTPTRMGGNSDWEPTMSVEDLLNQLLAIQPSWGRRLFEGLAAGSAMVLLSPLVLLIALAIKISSPGPIHYSQMRVGHGGRTFRCYKFRTMQPHSDTTVHENYLTYLMHHDVPMHKLDRDGDPRVSPLGRFLRAASLDELPQLLNVVRGDMSLFGPRPCTLNEYREYLPWHRHRVDVRPGISGLWQVSGKNKTTFTEMMRLDLRYVQRHTFSMNLRILLKTIPVVVMMFVEHHMSERAPSRRALAAGKPVQQTVGKARQPTWEEQ